MGFCHITPTNKILALCNETIGFIDFWNGKEPFNNLVHSQFIKEDAEAQWFGLSYPSKLLSEQTAQLVLESR